jgi:hypothetical protein
MFQHSSKKIPGRFQHSPSRKVPGMFQHSSNKIPGRFQHSPSRKVPGMFQQSSNKRSRKAPVPCQDGSSTFKKVPARFQQG